MSQHHPDPSHATGPSNTPATDLDGQSDRAVRVAETASADTGRHRGGLRWNAPATMVTAGIAAAALLAAGFTSFGGGGSSNLDAFTVPTTTATSGMVSTTHSATESALDGVLRGVDRQQTQAGAVRIERIQTSIDSVNLSAGTAQDASTSAIEKAEEIAAEREAARIAAEEKAAEEAAAAAAEQQAAEARAAEQEAAREQEAAAAREAEREPAPVQEEVIVEEEVVEEVVEEEAPAPEPAPAPVTGDSRSIARGMLSSYGWGDDQWGCLNSLWERESNWNHTAQNPSSGAYGIPQSLPGNKMASAGADWQTNPATQIRWGLGYIQGRYGTPCGAWAHSESVGWY